MLLGDGNELDDFVFRFIAELSEALLLFSSGADLDPLLFFNLSLKAKKHFIFFFNKEKKRKLLISDSKIQNFVVAILLVLSQSNPLLSLAQNEQCQHQNSTTRDLFERERERERESRKGVQRLKWMEERNKED